MFEFKTFWLTPTIIIQSCYRFTVRFIGPNQAFMSLSIYNCVVMYFCVLKEPPLLTIICIFYCFTLSYYNLLKNDSYFQG